MNSPAAVVNVVQPRILLQPPAVSTAGPEVAELATLAGLQLDPWQRLALDVGLGEQANGQWAAFEVGLIVSRQNGKGSILEAVELGGLFLFDEELILHSAHEFKTAKEAFRRIRSLIMNTEELAEQVKQIKQSNEEVSIELRSGKRLRFVARSGGSGRGFTGDRIILDEAYNLGPDAMAALLPTLSARPNPQIWYTSSAPMATSHQLHAVRKRALAGSASRLAFLEWSAAETFAEIDLDDVDAWRRANPAMPHRISEEFVANERAALSEAIEEFARERLGIPDRPQDEHGDGALIALWHIRSNPEAAMVDPVCLSFDVAPDQDSASIAAAGAFGDRTAVEVIANRPGTDWVVAELVRLIEAHSPAQVVADLRGPAGGLKPDLDAAGVVVHEITTQEHGQACSLFQKALTDDALWHRGQPELAAAIAGAGRRPVGDAWLWSRRSSKVDISPLVAATLAHWAHRQPQTTTGEWFVDLADFLEDDE